MFLTRILGARGRPCLYSLKNTRSLRPCIKVGKDRFQLSLDVHHYNKDEIRVQAHPEYVVIEGKQEKTTRQGYILRQFIRKFKLPEGCVPGKIETKLSPDGILTVTAPRSFCNGDILCNPLTVPISYSSNSKDNELEKSKNLDPSKPALPDLNPSTGYPKLKPGDE